MNNRWMNVPHFQYPSTRWPSAVTHHWRTCPIFNIWAAGCKATGATRQTYAIDWRSHSRIQLIDSHVGRPQTIASNQTAAVPSLCVLVPYTLVRGLDPQSNGDEIDEQVQQQVSARNNW